MTMELADKIEGLAAKATPGPWHKHTGAIGVNPWIGGSNGEKGTGEYVRGGCILNMVAHNEREDDASLIVTLVNNLPAILAALRTEPPADVAGLVERLNETDWGPNVTDTLMRWDADRKEAAATLTTQAREIERLREAVIDCAVSLAAAISLLERGGKSAKKAAPSDKMFDQMVVDYKASLERARTALGGEHG